MEKVVPRLTPREWETFALLAKGKAKKDIAEELGVSYATVRTHLERGYKKLSIHKATQAVAFFLKHKSALCPTIQTCHE